MRFNCSGVNSTRDVASPDRFGGVIGIEESIPDVLGGVLGIDMTKVGDGGEQTWFAPPPTFKSTMAPGPLKNLRVAVCTCLGVFCMF